MENLKACPLCGLQEFETKLQASYFRGQREDFSICGCLNCGFYFTNPRPRQGAELDHYYQTEDYVSHNEQQGGLLNRVYFLVRSYALKNKRALLNKINGGQGRLLDYGAGSGAFIKTCREAGWRVTGVEPGSSAQQFAQEKGLEMFAPPDRDYRKKEHYDVISMWHVLEHLPELKSDFERLVSYLKPRGHMVVAVPNRNSADAQAYGSRWAAWDLPLHLYHFRAEDIRHLAAQHQMEVSRIINMPFDAFYVSLMSESRNNQKPNYLRAFRRALLSNLKGWRSKNMSSLIYVLRKN